MSEQIDFDKIVQEFRGSYVSDSYTILSIHPLKSNNYDW